MFTLNTGYFKPVANGRSLAGNVDMDAVLMKEVLDLKAPLKKIAPFTASPSYLSAQSNLKEALDNILQAYHEVSKDADIMLIDGALSPDILGRAERPFLGTAANHSTGHSWRQKTPRRSWTASWPPRWKTRYRISGNRKFWPAS